MSQDNNEGLSLGHMIRKVLRRWWVFLIVLPIVGGLSGWYIFQIPRTYSSSVTMAPESSEGTTMGGLASMASSFGVNLGGLGGTSDAFYPVLYPDIVSTNDFLISLLDLRVQTLDGRVKTDFYTYLAKYQKKSPLDEYQKVLKDKLKKYFPQEPVSTPGAGSGRDINPFMLSEKQAAILERMRNNIVCSVDKKTEVITISVTDQDRLVCAVVADSVCNRLQRYIIDYRTRKARHDQQYYQNLTDEAKLAYDKSVKLYSSYVDKHSDLILQAYISERDNLESDMQMKYNTYNALLTQLQAANAKVQESIPAFTVFQGATVPIKPSGPKRMLFVLGMTFMAFFITAFIVVNLPDRKPRKKKEKPAADAAQPEASEEPASEEIPLQPETEEIIIGAEEPNS